ncbi:MAG: hypothetical protein COT92_03500 [Candidatus Doudnabacteria bacterium CG10_big_fil_rev_8_21_14_0_10_42_18]|uniref:Uncharacterized protein n=1 Tax=Candidatus Doudnabacteria bacterium CG10_big_fil_rev_8_21_14_0_10_42_18 TaxID=1974552 RepID=A0A2H0VA77_9BACT|nr:MAG: hypothetical protein COT92_03500 [Candidatus Doudnabacteria bacterium CG10_big_fil_rev_8_21_14_0_10_42_18]
MKETGENRGEEVKFWVTFIKFILDEVDEMHKKVLESGEKTSQELNNRYDVWLNKISAINTAINGGNIHKLNEKVMEEIKIESEAILFELNKLINKDTAFKA